MAQISVVIAPGHLRKLTINYPQVVRVERWPSFIHSLTCLTERDSDGVVIINEGAVEVEEYRFEHDNCPRSLSYNATAQLATKRFSSFPFTIRSRNCRPPTQCLRHHRRTEGLVLR